MDEYYRILESLPPALRTPLAKLDATMRRTFRRSVCGWASPYSSRFAADCAPRPNFCPERVCLPRWRPTPAGLLSAALPPLGLRL